MKIALVRARYNPFGGAERFVARALRALAADRDDPPEVAVLARRWQDTGETQGVDDTPPIRFVRCDPFYIGSVWRDASFAKAVHAHLRDESFDLVQSHERIAGLPIYRAGDGVHASWLERRARMVDAPTRVGMALNPHHRYLIRTERAMFEHPLLRAVICNSEMVRREIAERFAIARDKLVLVRNGVDLDRFHPDARAAHRDAMRRRLNIAPDACVFVLVGSGFERKGVRQALEALHDVNEAVLVIVGDDKHRDRYEAQAASLDVASRVRFVGAVADPLPYYAMADVFLLPTIYDPFPNAALEALACGLPVITTDACGAAELIEEGVNGWVLASGQTSQVGEAMRKAAVLDDTQWHSMSQAARHTADPYSLAALSEALLALYRSLGSSRLCPDVAQGDNPRRLEAPR